MQYIPQRWRSRSIAIVAGVVLAGIVFWLVLQSPAILLAYRAAHYRRDHDADSLWVVLKSFRNGNRVENVERILGSAPRNNDPKYRAICAKVMAANPVTAPHGFIETDELLAYPAQGMTIFLQFRDGNLVNFNPSDYPMEFNALY